MPRKASKKKRSEQVRAGGVVPSPRPNLGKWEAIQNYQRVLEQLEGIQDLAIKDYDNLTPGEYMMLDIMSHDMKRASLEFWKYGLEAPKTRKLPEPKQKQQFTEENYSLKPTRSAEEILKELGF